MKLGDSEVTVRSMDAGDRNFLLATWLRSAKDITRMGQDKFFVFTRPQVEADLDNGVVLVACDKESPGTVYSWACFRDGVLRWAYTVYKLRNNGLHTYLKEQYETAASKAFTA